MSVNSCPGLQTRVLEEAHPSECAGNPYSQDMQKMVMFVFNHILGDDKGGVMNMMYILCHQHMYPSSRTCRRWAKLHQDHGHLLPCQRSRNSFSKQMKGPGLLYLALFRAFYPKATIAEANTFLYNANLGNLFWGFYSHSQIHRGEVVIGLRWKRASITAYQALYPINLHKR